MLIVTGFVLIVLGLAALLIDRRPPISSTTMSMRGRISSWTASPIMPRRVIGWRRRSWRLVGAALARHFGARGGDLALLINYSLAFIASLTLGSAVLHAIKLVLGRRRPRDDMEMGLYGFMPLAFNLEYNSFPSGHALTICCVAVIFTCVWPLLWPLWFAVAAVLAVTRALLTAHFLSDVLIGAGIGLIAAREVLLLGFPGYAPIWF